jgi:hypothetical protein
MDDLSNESVNILENGMLELAIDGRVKHNILKCCTDLLFTERVLSIFPN